MTDINYLWQDNHVGVPNIVKPLTNIRPLPSKGWPKIWNRALKDEPSESYFMCNWDILESGYTSKSTFQAPVQYDDDETLDNFKAYVNEQDYFWTKLPRLEIVWSGKDDAHNFRFPDLRTVSVDYINDDYFASLFGMYVASFVSGISLQNLKDVKAPKIVKSISKFHLYFQTRKFTRFHDELTIYDKYIPNVKKLIPHRIVKHYKSNEYGIFTDEKTGEQFGIKGLKKSAYEVRELGNRDYMCMIARTSKGLTTIGRKLFSESLQAYVYCILQAQFKYKRKIAPDSVLADYPQKEFIRLVATTINGYQDLTLPNDVDTALINSNAILNLAITPGLELAPSNLGLSEKLPGYANTIKKATDGMSFGLNSAINYNPADVTALGDPDEVKTDMELRVEKKPVHDPSKVDPNLTVASDKPLSRFGEYSTVILIGSIVVGSIVTAKLIG